MPKLNVEFSEEASELLLELAYGQDTTHTEILRRAVHLEKWFIETIDSGARVFVRYPDGREAEVGKRQ